MDTVSIIFGMFGLFAYGQLTVLKKRVIALEKELAGIAGTSLYEERRALLDAIETYIGKPVILDLKEDYEDEDISMYGNSKHSTNTILDADGDWMLVRIDSAKGSKEKLIRTGSVQQISLVDEM